MDTTKHIEDLIRSDMDADAALVASLGGPSALASFVLDYIRLSVDWRHLHDNLRGVTIAKELSDVGGPKAG